MRSLVLVFAALAAALASATATRALADDVGNRRVRAGARLFRALLAAEIELDKRVAADGKLHIVVFGNDATLKPEVTELIAAGGEPGNSGIRGFPVAIESVSNVRSLPRKPRPAGLFVLSYQPDPTFKALIRWSRSESIVLYSPIEGDVERGAAAGLSVEATVRPYLNLSELKAAGINIKPFFMKVAKVQP